MKIDIFEPFRIYPTSNRKGRRAVLKGHYVDVCNQ